MSVHVHEYAKFTVYHVTPPLNVGDSDHVLRVNDARLASVAGAVLNITIEYPPVVVQSSAVTTTVKVQVTHNANEAE